MSVEEVVCVAQCVLTAERRKTLTIDCCKVLVIEKQRHCKDIKMAVQSERRGERKRRRRSEDLPGEW